MFSIKAKFSRATTNDLGERSAAWDETGSFSTQVSHIVLSFNQKTQPFLLRDALPKQNM
jgi:hypothetical protein